MPQTYNMASKYRLFPKPGLARAGRFVGTKVNPVIITNKSNIVKIKTPKRRGPIQRPIPQKIAQSPRPQKIAPSQAVQRVNIQRPIQRPVNKSTRAVSANKRRNFKRSKSSPVRSRKEHEIGKYQQKVDDLKNSGVGRLLIMVACGPSILEVDLPKLKEHPLIDLMSINRPDPRVHPTKYWVFCDQSQYVRNKEIFHAYKGTMINAWSVRARHPNQVLIRNKSGKGFSKDLSKGYYIGRSTTFANMQTAHWMNYDRVFIFGCDMCQPPGSDKLHFYGRNQDVDPQIRVKRFQKEAEHYMIGTKQLTLQERQKFVFCSAHNDWPFTEHYKKLDHKVAVEHILQLADGMKQR